jgi:hypothetical protein
MTNDKFKLGSYVAHLARSSDNSPIRQLDQIILSSAMFSTAPRFRLQYGFSALHNTSAQPNEEMEGHIATQGRQAMRGRSFLALFLTGMLLCTGCRCASSPAEPPCPPPDSGGQLLKTGAIQLGPGLMRNNYRWMGDGQGRLE